MTTYIFPGQGSQIRGMGDALFSEFPDIVEKADGILGYSIAKLCLEDPDAHLNKTEYTQPALYVVNALSYLKKVRDKDAIPTYVAGHSLGEYNALHAAGVFDFETGLTLVQKRGELMGQATGGGMAAVIGLKNTELQALLQTQHLTEISIANENSHLQIVISGQKAAIEAAQPIFISAGARLFIPLNVSGAFHSPYMRTAQQQFADFLNRFTVSSPSLPVIANVTAKPYQPSEVLANLAAQMTHSVLWTQSIEYLLMQGETTFEEIGPGKVLSGLVSRIRKGQ